VGGGLLYLSTGTKRGYFDTKYEVVFGGRGLIRDVPLVRGVLLGDVLLVRGALLGYVTLVRGVLLGYVPLV
jgi:hypothetical protein